MNFHSTNYNSPDVDFKEAVLKGQASDNGLYSLNHIPKLSEKVFESFKKASFKEIAYYILSQFIANLIPDNDLKRIVDEIFNFKVPIEKVRNSDYLCYLDQGPTCSFKDFGARTLARVMEYFLQKESRNALILTATSGDTGGAVAQAFYEMKQIKVIVLYPKNEVSDLQRKQMTTLGKNITAIGITGKFDDCQKLAKMAFSDEDLNSLNLTSANSINIGRLLPQTLYYFWSYSRLFEELGEKVVFSVPSGNFGNLTAGLIAYRMGLPVHKFISAVNENDEFPLFLSSGEYKQIKPSRNCISNAMNVGHPSNLARIIDMYHGQMDENGVIHIKPNMLKLTEDIISYSIDDDSTKNTIAEFYQNYHKLIEPHGAVGWAALNIFRNQFPQLKNTKSIVFETAHPSKFPDDIMALTNQTPILPKSLKIISRRSENPNPVEIHSYDTFKKYLIQSFNS